MPFDKLAWQRDYDKRRRQNAAVRESERLGSKKWRDRHPGYKSQYSRIRRNKDSTYRALENARRRVRHVLRGVAADSARTYELLGCSGFELRELFESLFTRGMTWDNYGIVWEVDHKKPCAQFDFALPGQLEECFHFSNLRPLEAVENRRKRDK